MKYLKLHTNSSEETHRLGIEIGRLSQPGDVYLLLGNLGSGKTCLTQGIAWGLGIEEYAMSPSFVLVRELWGRLLLYHMDLYRLDHIEEIADLGLDDYLYGKGVSVVEWAEKGLSLLPPEHLQIRIDGTGENGRSFNLTPSGSRYEELVKSIEHVWCGKAENAARD